MKKKIIILICLSFAFVMTPRIQAFQDKEIVETNVNHAQLDRDGQIVQNKSFRVGAVLGQGSTSVYKTIVNTSKVSTANTQKHYEEYNGQFQSGYAGDLMCVKERVTENGSYETTFSGFLSYIPKPTGYRNTNN